MTISEPFWLRYIDTLHAIDNTAAKMFEAYLNTHDISTKAGRQAAIDYAYALATKYGESAAAVSCEMYDAVVRASGVTMPAAEPAATATYSEVARAVNGVLKNGYGQSTLVGVVGNAVKRAGADTTIKNAMRDGAEYAWIPHGETCAFCLMLGSRGWQQASKKTLKGDHAEHIHNNCDCTFAIRFSKDTEYSGYDPDRLRAQYDNAEGRTWREKLNSIRREQYAENPEAYRAQKRESYARVRERKKEPIVTDTPQKPANPTYGHKDVTNDWLKQAIPNSHPVRDIESFTQDGVTYIVDGEKVKFKYDAHEKKIAELLQRELGGEIGMMPKADDPQHVRTPDYFFRGERYDLKTMSRSESRNAVYNRVNEAQDQAASFVLDITGNPLGREEIIRQSELIFQNYNTRGVKRIILIEDEVIIKILERK